MAVKELIEHCGTRGWFKELIRRDDDFFEEFGQLSLSAVYRNVVKAWHYHVEQTDWWYVIYGEVIAAFYDYRTRSPTYRQTMTRTLNPNTGIVKVPPGVLHGYKCKSEYAQMLYVTSKVYDVNDEGRIDADDPRIGFDWDSV